MARVSKNRVTDNILVSPSDFSTYCVTAPLDPRLPGRGGYQICGMADVKEDVLRAGGGHRPAAGELPQPNR